MKTNYCTLEFPLNTTEYNFNRIPLFELPNYFDSRISEFEQSRFWEAEIFTLSYTSFKEMLASISDSEVGNRILALESERNDLWESILDVIDDSLNHYIDDWQGDIKRIGLTEEEVFDRIPERVAAIRILPSDEKGKPIFPTHRSKKGHLWEESEYSNLLVQFRKKELIPSLEVLEIKRLVFELFAVEHNLVKLTKSHNLETSLESLRKNRKTLAFISSLNTDHTLSNISVFKRKNIINHLELISSDIDAYYANEELLEFSPNDFSLSQFAIIVKKMVESNMYPVLKNLWEHGMKKRFSFFSKRLHQFQSKDFYHELEESETMLYRSFELFYITLEYCQINSAASYSEDASEAFEESDTFYNATTITDELKEHELQSDGWRGMIFSNSDIEGFIEVLSKPELLVALEELKLITFYNEICQSQEHILKLLGETMRDELVDLRDSRKDITLFLGLMKEV